jgi:hypothetical protein
MGNKKFRENHPNDVIAKDGWHVVRNERSYDLYGMDKKLIWYNTYHYHEGVGLSPCHQVPSAMEGLVFSSTTEVTLEPHLWCRRCSEEAPDYIQGFLKLIAWGDKHED